MTVHLMLSFVDTALTSLTHESLDISYKHFSRSGQERKLANLTHSGRCVGYMDSSNTCAIIDEKTNRLFKRPRAKVFERTHIMYKRI